MAAPISNETLHDQLNQVLLKLGELDAKITEKHTPQEGGSSSKAAGGAPKVAPKTAFGMLFLANPAASNIPAKLILQFTAAYREFLVKYAIPAVFDESNRERAKYLKETIEFSEAHNKPIEDTSTFNEKRSLVLAAIESAHAKKVNKDKMTAWYNSDEIQNLIAAANTTKNAKAGKATTTPKELPAATLDSLNNNLANSWGLDSGSATTPATNGTSSAAPTANVAANGDEWSF